MGFPQTGWLLTPQCALPPRVLESLLVALVTTVVVFVASMVLGECRQMSEAQLGNDSIQLQVMYHRALQPLENPERPGRGGVG